MKNKIINFKINRLSIGDQVIAPSPIVRASVAFHEKTEGAQHLASGFFFRHDEKALPFSGVVEIKNHRSPGGRPKEIGRHFAAYLCYQLELVRAKGKKMAAWRSVIASIPYRYSSVKSARRAANKAKELLPKRGGHIIFDGRRNGGKGMVLLFEHSMNADVVTPMKQGGLLEGVFTGWLWMEGDKNATYGEHEIKIRVTPKKKGDQNLTA